VRLILTTDTVGGVWTFTKELATELLLRGHEIWLVSFGRPPSFGHQEHVTALQHQYPGSFRYTSSEAPLEWMQTNEAAFDGGAKLLLALDESFHPDAYLFGQFCYGALPVKARKVVTAHSDVLSWAVACGETLDENSAWMRTYRELVWRGLSEADAVVSPTAAYLSDLRTHFPGLPDTQQVIPNGRSIAPIFLETRNLQAVTAGRMWDKAKNLRVLFGTTFAMPIVMAGEFDDQCVVSSSRLRWIGQQNEAELFRLFRRSAVYLCTSVYEPFGLAPLEAALCGCAVIAMDIPSLREVWGTGALYFHDSDSLAVLLKHLSESPEALSQAKSMSYKRATFYTTARMADRYQDLLMLVTGTQHEVSTHAA
jgi:glycogen(starch) synthase